MTEIEQLQEAFNSFACEVMAIAISGLADAAIVSNQTMSERHALAAVQQLANYARDLRSKIVTLGSRNMGFKSGDVVKLKAGGPPMTVNGPTYNELVKGSTDQVRCVWFDYDNQLQRETFDCDSLELTDQRLEKRT